MLHLRLTVIVLVMASLCLVGCNRLLNNRCTAVDTLREFPNGDAVAGTVTWEEGPFVHRREQSQLVWQRPGQPDKVLAETPPPSPSSTPYYDACRTAEAHLSPDGNRAWLTKDGKVLASFDRQAGTASFDEHRQPDWAKP